MYLEKLLDYLNEGNPLYGSMNSLKLTPLMGSKVEAGEDLLFISKDGMNVEFIEKFKSFCLNENSLDIIAENFYPLSYNFVWEKIVAINDNKIEKNNRKRYSIEENVTFPLFKIKFI